MGDLGSASPTERPKVPDAADSLRENPVSEMRNRPTNRSILDAGKAHTIAYSHSKYEIQGIHVREGSSERVLGFRAERGDMGDKRVVKTIEVTIVKRNICLHVFTHRSLSAKGRRTTLWAMNNQTVGQLLSRTVRDQSYKPA
eukprot:1011257-Pyramimonas_sp.AAC.1